MGIKYRASMSKRDYKKVPIIELDCDEERIYVCDAITMIPSKHSRYCLFDCVDLVLHNEEKEPIRLRCCCDGVHIKDHICVDIEHKTKYTGMFAYTLGQIGRLMVHCDGLHVTVSVLDATDDSKTV